MTPEWIWLLFIFAFGACVGSFLNVVVYRLPLDKSIVSPPSACPSCNTRIPFYDNIPLVSWLVLRGRCRVCKASISPRYFVIELCTALLFGGVYLWLFTFQFRRTGLAGADSMQRFFSSGGWLIYLNIMVLVAAFLAASAIDLELWVIPLSICWLVTAVGIASSTLSPWLIQLNESTEISVFPLAGPRCGAVSVGSALGLVFSLVALKKKWIQTSYELPEDQKPDKDKSQAEPNPEQEEPEFDDRREIFKEMVFLLPILIGGLAGYGLMKNPALFDRWVEFSQLPVISGLLGSLAGYFSGCAVVWATRIFGTLLFGREAMGLGDVHLMGAAGAVIGAGWVVLAFFVAPFFGLGWALYQLLTKKSRQIPYGPFLSLAVFVVILFQDRIYAYLARFYGI